MHILSSEQFDHELLGDIFDKSDEFRELLNSDNEKRELANRYAGNVLVNLFYEPSTRTRLSFDIGAQRLGMIVVGTEDAEQFSSAAKGETLEDTIRVLNEYGSSIIVLRHKETGAAARAAAVSEAAIFNAGDGKGEHPSQAVLDTYTIKAEKGRLDDLDIVVGGDLARGRTVRSLVKLASTYPDNRLSFVSSKELQIGDDIKEILEESSTPFVETTEMAEVFGAADVIYWTRTQNERAEKLGRFSLKRLLPSIRHPQEFIIEESSLAVMSDDAIIMHPLPKVKEISKIVDSDPRAKYFRQAGNGMFTRMALIDREMKQRLPDQSKLPDVA